MEKNFFAVKKESGNDDSHLEDVFDHEQNRELIERLQSIIRVLSGRENLHVTTQIDPETRAQLERQGQDPDQTWFHTRGFNRQTKKLEVEYVHVPSKILESSENVAKGKAAHEAAHAAITRMGEFIPDEVMRELGFGSLISAIEELPTDETVRRRYEGAGSWVDEARADSLRDMPEGFDENVAIRRMPKFAQLCNLLVYGRHYKQIPEGYDREVVDFYRRNEKEIRDIEQTIPKEGSSEEEIVEKAKDRYRKIYKKIWKEAKKFIETDRREKQIEEILKEAQRDSESDESQEGQEQERDSKENPVKKAIEDLLKKLPENLKQELEKVIKETKKETPQKQEKSEDDAQKEFQEEKDADIESEEKQGSGGEEEGDEDESKGDGKSSGEEKNGKKSGEEKKGESSGKGDFDFKEENEESESEEESETDSEQESERESKSEKQKEDDSKKEKSFGKQSSDSTDTGSEESSVKERKDEQGDFEISKELEDALMDMMKKMPKEVSDQIKRNVEEILKEVEDRLIKDFRGGLDQSPIETHEQREERLQEEKMAQDHEREMREIEKRIAMATRDSSSYDEVYRDIRALDRRLYDELERVFSPNVKSESSMRITGSKINLPAVFRREADIGAGSKNPRSRIFEVTKHPEKKDYAITILVDLSGSMEEGDKMAETFKGVVLLTEVISRLGIKLEILGFHNDEMLTFKEFDDSLNDEIRKKISSMPGEAGGDNDDGPSLEKASSRLEKQSGNEKIIIMLSDGKPSRYSNSSEKLRKAIEKITKQTQQKLIGVGLGRSAQHVKDYYPVSLPGISTDELAETLGLMLMDVIENPNKYFGK